MPEWLSTTLILYSAVACVWLFSWFLVYIDAQQGGDPLRAAGEAARQRKRAARMLVSFPLWPAQVLWFIGMTIASITATIPAIIRDARPSNFSCSRCQSDRIAVYASSEENYARCDDCRYTWDTSQSRNPE